MNDRRPDDGGSKHLWNVGKLLPDYTEQHTRIQSSPSAQFSMGIKYTLHANIVKDRTSTYSQFESIFPRLSQINRLLILYTSLHQLVIKFRP
jgi:hypothetical protein